MSENNAQVMQAQPANSEGTIDDTYTITVQLTMDVPLSTIVEGLQMAYDSGAAGAFEVFPATEPGGIERTIVFKRYAYSDMEYVEPRIEGGRITPETAACLQLAAELEDSDFTEVVEPIANALRAIEPRPVVNSISPQAMSLFCAKQLAQEPPQQTLERAVGKAMEVSTGVSLLINAPGFFQDAEFIGWLNNGQRKFTWHQGHSPDEWSDVVVLVDPGLTGAGSDTEMPEHIWEQIVDACRTHLKGQVSRFSQHIMVRLTNVTG